MVQYPIKGGWADRYDTLAYTRARSIHLWEEEMKILFRKERRKGKVRCIKVKVVPAMNVVNKKFIKQIDVTIERRIWGPDDEYYVIPEIQVYSSEVGIAEKVRVTIERIS
jgi:hypothetical protein